MSVTMLLEKDIIAEFGLEHLSIEEQKDFVDDVVKLLEGRILDRLLEILDNEELDKFQYLLEQNDKYGMINFLARNNINGSFISRNELYNLEEEILETSSDTFTPPSEELTPSQKDADHQLMRHLRHLKGSELISDKDEATRKGLHTLLGHFVGSLLIGVSVFLLTADHTIASICDRINPNSLVWLQAFVEQRLDSETENSTLYSNYVLPVIGLPAWIGAIVLLMLFDVIRMLLARVFILLLAVLLSPRRKVLEVIMKLCMATHSMSGMIIIAIIVGIVLGLWYSLFTTIAVVSIGVFYDHIEHIPVISSIITGVYDEKKVAFQMYVWVLIIFASIGLSVVLMSVVYYFSPDSDKHKIMNAVRLSKIGQTELENRRRWISGIIVGTIVSVLLLILDFMPTIMQLYEKMETGYFWLGAILIFISVTWFFIWFNSGAIKHMQAEARVRRVLRLVRGGGSWRKMVFKTSKDMITTETILLNTMLGIENFLGIKNFPKNLSDEMLNKILYSSVTVAEAGTLNRIIDVLDTRETDRLLDFVDRSNAIGISHLFDEKGIDISNILQEEAKKAVLAHTTDEDLELTSSTTSK